MTERDGRDVDTGPAGPGDRSEPEGQRQSDDWPDDERGGLDLTSGRRPDEPVDEPRAEHDYYETFSTRRKRTAWRGRPSAADERPGRTRAAAAAPATHRPVEPTEPTEPEPPAAAYDDEPDGYLVHPDHPDHPDHSDHGDHGDDRADVLLPTRAGGRRRARPRRNIAPLLVLAVVAALVVGGGAYGFARLKDRLAPAPDYAGPGSGQVSFQVQQGQSVSSMGRGLAKLGVVKSADAFVDAARKDDRATGIQVGYYSLKKQMSAQGALSVLVDPDNLIKSVVLVPEGARVRDVVKTIVAKTDFSRASVVQALESPKLGLPAAAKGNPEGYLFPATYTVTPGETALTLLQQMVGKANQVDQQLGLAAKAKAKNLSVQQVLTVASILQYEANRSVDYPKVARVIYNRLNQDMALQLDSTVSYTSGRSGDVWTTAAERGSSSAYNTYQHTGLPPGPIGSPGEATIKAALDPARGDWLYFVPDFANGTTLFTSSYSEHLKNVAKAKQYCRTHDSC